jgi:CRP-like cAMP-binding protein
MLLDLDARASSVTCKGGTLLFRSEDITENVIVLLSGRVKLYLGSNAKRIVFHVADRGEILGLMSLIATRPQGVNAEAISACHLLSIQSSDFHNVLGNSPQSWRGGARELARSYERSCSRLRMIGCAPGNSAKLACLLLEWSKDIQPEKDGIKIPMQLRRYEIAEYIGIRREDVSRILASFQRNDILEQNGSILNIKDRLALERLAKKGRRQSCPECAEPLVFAVADEQSAITGSNSIQDRDVLRIAAPISSPDSRVPACA